MLITATTALVFFGLAIACVVLGHYIKRIELYAFGVLLIFLFSGFVWYNGISEQKGMVVVKNNVTMTDTTTFQYDQNRDLWVDFLSVGGMLLGVFLAINTYQEYETEKKRKREEDIE